MVRKIISTRRLFGAVFFIRKGQNMNEYNISVLGKIFTAVESGGQIYGKGRWDDVTLPHFGNEKTLTLGAYQFGGGSNEGRDLLRLIRERHPETFAKFDTCGIAATLDIDWYSTGFTGSKHSGQQSKR